MANKTDNKITEIADKLYHIYDSLDVFYSLIVGTEYALIIDSGYGFGNVYETVRSLTDLPIRIINTHGHIDHIQGNVHFKEVLIHKDDFEIYRKHSSLIMKAGLYMNVKSILPPDQKGLLKYLKPITKKLKAISDGEIIELGNREVEVIHTPGHTKGSVCILDKKTRTLISGDSFSSHIWLCLNESTSISEYIKTVEKVISRSSDFNEIISSHSLARFKPTILPKIKHCAENISIEKSRSYMAALAGESLIYKEGFEEVTRRYGFKNFNQFIMHVAEVPVEEIAKIEFTSIVYKPEKLN